MPLFFTPEIYTPLIFLAELGTGANRPVLIRAITERGRREDVVVKLMASERMHPTAALKELVASLIAKSLGLPVPDPCLVDVDKNFTNTIGDLKIRDRLLNSQGLNFASINVTGLQSFTALSTLNTTLRNQALLIFYFDLLIQNADRTVAPGGKTNLFTDRNGLCILDHELSFSFLEMLFATGQPWELSTSDRETLAENHILFNKLKGLRLDFAILESFLDSIDPSFWEHVVTVVPVNWQGGALAKIKDHIVAVRNNQADFTVMIKTLLA